MRIIFQLAVAAALTAVLLPKADAAERVTLANGFALECDHIETAERSVRLYMDAGEKSYIELKATDLAGVERIPDPPRQHVPASQPKGADTAPSEAELHQVLSTAGRAHNLDVDLLASVVKAESGGNAHAVSRAGARGLMQLMPATANDLGVADSFEPSENAGGGSAYLDALLTHYHENLALALAAYNAGPAAVDKYHGIPPYRETQIYVARVIHEFNRRVRARATQSQLGGDSIVLQRNQGSR